MTHRIAARSVPLTSERPVQARPSATAKATRAAPVAAYPAAKRIAAAARIQNIIDAQRTGMLSDVFGWVKEYFGSKTGTGITRENAAIAAELLSVAKSRPRVYLLSETQHNLHHIARELDKVADPSLDRTATYDRWIESVADFLRHC